MSPKPVLNRTNAALGLLWTQVLLGAYKVH